MIDEAKLKTLLTRLGPAITEPAEDASWSDLMKKWVPGEGFGDDVTQEEIDAQVSKMFMSGGAAPPIPAVTLEEFFDGNGDAGSLQVARFEEMPRILAALRARDDVADIRIGVTQWEGEGTWPLGEYLFVVTSAPAETVMGWLAAEGIHAGEYGIGREHRAREQIPTPDGMHVVWVWFD